MSGAEGDDTAEKAIEVADAYTVLLARHLVKILKIGDKDGREAVGSGFLVKHNDCVYVVSAAHVFDHIEPKAPLTFVTVDQEEFELVGSLRKTELEDGQIRDNDPIDTGVLKLDTSRISRAARLQMLAVPIEQLTPAALPRQDKTYMVLGFPISKFEFIQQNKTGSFDMLPTFNSSSPSTAYGDLCLPETDHIMMPWPKKGIRGKDLKRMSRPGVRGLSGAPVWILYDRNGDNDPAKTPIAGIFTDFRKIPGITISSDIGKAIDYIIEEW